MSKYRIELQIDGEWLEAQCRWQDSMIEAVIKAMTYWPSIKHRVVPVRVKQSLAMAIEANR